MVVDCEVMWVSGRDTGVDGMLLGGIGGRQSVVESSSREVLMEQLQGLSLLHAFVITITRFMF
jgi:hypothetical protein